MLLNLLKWPASSSILFASSWKKLFLPWSSPYLKSTCWRVCRTRNLSDRTFQNILTFLSRVWNPDSRTAKIFIFEPIKQISFISEELPYPYLRGFHNTYRCGIFIFLNVLGPKSYRDNTLSKQYIIYAMMVCNPVSEIMYMYSNKCFIRFNKFLITTLPNSIINLAFMSECDPHIQRCFKNIFKIFLKCMNMWMWSTYSKMFLKYFLIFFKIASNMWITFQHHVDECQIYAELGRVIISYFIFPEIWDVFNF